MVWLVRQSQDVCLYRRAGGYGVALDVWPFLSLAVCPHFVFGADLGVGNPSADFFILHTHIPYKVWMCLSGL